MPRRLSPLFTRNDRFRAAVALLLLPVLLIGACGKSETKGTEEKTINVQVRAVETKSLRPFFETI